MIRAAEPESAGGIDLTPIVDVVFLLLVFFLVATTFREAERELDVELPAAASAAPLSAALREVIVNVDAEGRMIVAGRETTPDALVALVRDAVAVNPDRRVVVRGDRRAAYDAVMRALDACRTGGATRPFLDAAPAVE